jgi:bis(5'-nucleosyl)-tetraphosphatase (symmetrical)
MNSKRIIALTDLHGCLDEFDELLKLLSYNKEEDDLYLLGDLVGRGKNSVGVVKRARELDLKCCRGNWEQKFLRWYRGNKFLDEEDYYSKFNDDDIAYLMRTTYYFKPRENLWLFHAGVKPGIPLDKQKPNDLMYLRYHHRKTGEFVSLPDIGKNVSKEDAVFWDELGSFGADVIYGHTVFNLETPRITEYGDGTAAYGIDTGCCFGGHLTALLDIDGRKEIVQIKAKERYVVSSFVGMY